MSRFVDGAIARSLIAPTKTKPLLGKIPSLFFVKKLNANSQEKQLTY
ncbi:MAG: hypothetical protein HC799_05630 [Limnothrix sp. RL_2_0]|nr:hypothetical protein [Limnothrix sp. RL_2_0]